MRSRRLVIFLLAAMAGFILFVCSRRMGAATGPSLEIPETFDLGIRDAGEVVEVHVPVRNRGSEPLKLREIRGSCGCVTVARQDDPDGMYLRDATIPPLAKLDLRVKLQVRDISGELREHIRFNCNDVGHEEAGITLRAKVYGGVRVVPAMVGLAKVSPGATARRTLRIFDNRRIDRRSPLQFVSSSGLTAVGSLVPCDPGKDDVGNIQGASCFMTSLSVRAPNNHGQFYETVQLIDRSGVRVSSVTISGAVGGLVTMNPSTVLLPSRRGEENHWSYEHRCICRCDSGPYVLKTIAIPEGIHVEISEGATKDMKYLLVRCPEDKMPFEGSRSIILTAEDESGKSERLELPVTLISLPAEYGRQGG